MRPHSSSEKATWPTASTVYVPLSPFQRFWYSRVLTKTDTTTLREVFKNAPEDENLQSFQQTVQRTMDETKRVR